MLAEAVELRSVLPTGCLASALKGESRPAAMLSPQLLEAFGRRPRGSWRRSEWPASQTLHDADIDHGSSANPAPTADRANTWPIARISEPFARIGLAMSPASVV